MLMGGAVLLTIVILLVSGVASGDQWEDKCREAIQRQYGYAEDWQEEEIETCAQVAKDWEEDGVSREEIYSQWGLR
jgi:hypothetical protein